jgi:peptidyl-prolyl cis-trans isomerase D
MLNTLRQYASNWVAQVLLGILVLSFAVWGVADVFKGFRADTLAQVGSVDVNVSDFERDYRNAVTALQRQLGTAITPQMAQQMGLPSQVLSRLVNQATLDDAAKRLGVGISNDMLGTKIATDPQFFGANGTFDRGYLTQLIRDQGMSEDQFIVSRRNEYIRAQLGQAFAGGVMAPETYLHALHEYRNEQRDVSYVVFDAPPAASIPDPSEVELAKFFDAHKTDWSAPEYRALTYFSLSPAEVAHADDVSDDEAKARYDASPQRFTSVEKRKVEQILFPDAATAAAAAAAIAGGKSFDAVATERGLKPEDVDLGQVTKAQIADPAIADAAFALAPNTISPVIEGGFGPVILRVTTVEPAVVTVFDDVKATLKQEIATERAVADITAMHDAIEDARAGGSTLAEVAGKYNLKLVNVPEVDQNGNDAAGTAVADLPAPVLKGAFETDVGLENDPVQSARNSFVWYEVTAVTAPRERALAEVRDKVVAAWKDAERKRLLDEDAKAFKAAVESTGDLFKLASGRPVLVRTATDLTRTTRPSGDLSAGALAAVFDAAKDSAIVAEGAQPMTALVVKVDDIAIPEFVAGSPDLAQQKQQLDSAFVGDLLTMYVAELQSKTDVRLNQAVLQQVLGATAN